MALPEGTRRDHQVCNNLRVGLLEGWDARNQRIVERQNKGEAERKDEWAKSNFVITGNDGLPVTVQAKPSGYPFRFVDNSVLLSTAFLLVGRLRNRYQYNGGWSVAVLRPGRVLAQKILRLERYRSKDEAQAGAKELARRLSVRK
jgi:hypothetical protein